MDKHICERLPQHFISDAIINIHGKIITEDRKHIYQEIYGYVYRDYPESAVKECIPERSSYFFYE